MHLGATHHIWVYESDLFLSRLDNKGAEHL